MKKILISTLVVISIISFSCKKETVKGTFTITGFLYNNCNMQPVAYYQLELDNNYGGNNNYDVLGSCTTKSNGYFSFTITDPKQGSLQLYGASGFGVFKIASFPSIKNYDSVTVYRNTDTKLSVSLNVINGGGVGDSIYISNSITENRGYTIGRFKAPISSGIITPLNTVDFVGGYNISDSSSLLFHVNYYKKDGTWSSKHFTYSFPFNKLCNGDTNKFVIPIDFTK